MASTRCPDGVGWYTVANGKCHITAGVHGSGLSLNAFKQAYGVDPLDHIEKEWSTADPNDYLTRETLGSVTLGRRYQSK